MSQQPEPLRAMVTAVHRERFAVRWDAQDGHARLKAGEYRDADPVQVPTVGDQVMLLPSPGGDGQIIATCPRKSLFVRRRPLVGGEQAVAANFDEVFILTSLNQDFSVRRVERYAAQAWQSGGTPVVILTKLDLVGDASAQVAAVSEVAPGVDVYPVSVLTGEGLDALRERLTPGKMIALLGMSGVGKSSLINGLMGEEVMAVKAIREDDARGRHTTTHRQLIQLPGGVCMIDTPGMRELGLIDAEEGVSTVFEEIEALAAHCRFADCAHKAEPGCAVKQAVADGRLEAERLRSYDRLQREAARRRRIAQVKKK